MVTALKAIVILYCSNTLYAISYRCVVSITIVSTAYYSITKGLDSDLYPSQRMLAKQSDCRNAVVHLVYLDLYLNRMLLLREVYIKAHVLVLCFSDNLLTFLI